MANKITIDPVTRIEGHLRIDCEVENGKVINAWSSGQMWRGIEIILRGRDPRDAWAYTQRICGVCTTVHAVASVRAVEDALKMEIPLNAQYIRNLIITAHNIFDHMAHFYQLSALDWVDIVSATTANASAAAALGQKLSGWRRNSTQEMQAVQDKLKKFIASGQLGIFASGYWGHPAMKLSPEVTLLAAAHYLQALEYERKINQVVAILGSKTPHIQNLVVGGVSNAIDPNSPANLTVEKLFHIKTLIDEVGEFINQAMLTDVAAIGAAYADWTTYGAGVMNYLCVPELPMDTKGTQYELAGGYIPEGDLGKFTPIRTQQESQLTENIKESIKHAWYNGDWDRSPYEGETIPKYTGFSYEDRYSWIKSPTYLGKPAQVGPLPHVVNLYLAGHEPTRRYVDSTLQTVSTLAGTTVGIEALHSTIGRIAARVIRAAVLHDAMGKQWQALMDNIGKGDYDTFNTPTFPKGEQRGVGFHEASRGTLSHWVIIENAKIKNYQCVVPSTWNAAPRNNEEALGPYEASLVGNPIADEALPLEVLRTIHSFDPCIACAVHLVDSKKTPLAKVQVL